MTRENHDARILEWRNAARFLIQDIYSLRRECGVARNRIPRDERTVNVVTAALLPFKERVVTLEEREKILRLQAAVLGLSPEETDSEFKTLKSQISG